MINKNKKKFNRAGFSLIEMIIAVGIFLMIITMLLSSFINVAKTQYAIRENRKKIEGAGTAIETMSKVIRMSSSTASYSNGKEIRLYNDSQDKCISYKFNDKNKDLEVSEAPASGNPSNCSNGNIYITPPYSYSPIVSGISSGLFKVTKTDITLPSRKGEDAIVKMGKATILIKIGRDNLQTSTSFMNYASIMAP